MALKSDHVTFWQISCLGVGNKDGELGENKVKEGVSKKTGEKLFCGLRTLVYSLHLLIWRIMRNCKLMKRKQIKTSPGWSLKIHLNLNCGEKSSNDLSSVMAIWRATWTRPTCSISSFAEFEGSDTKIALAFLLERKITTKNTFCSVLVNGDN